MIVVWEIDYLANHLTIEEAITLFSNMQIGKMECAEKYYPYYSLN